MKTLNVPEGFSVIIQIQESLARQTVETIPAKDKQLETRPIPK
jgi:hypothetical protein